MVKPDTPSACNSLRDGQCPACGAGVKRRQGGLFSCPACGLRHNGDAPDPSQNLVPEQVLFQGRQKSLLDSKILRRTPSKHATRGHDGPVEEAASGIPLSIAEGGQGFDAVHLIRHLEHAPDPVAELATARQLLTPRGLLYLDIGREGRWTIPVRAARRLIENAGFRVVRRIGRFSLSRRGPLRLWCRRY